MGETPEQKLARLRRQLANATRGRMAKARARTHCNRGHLLAGKNIFIQRGRTFPGCAVCHRNARKVRDAAGRSYSGRSPKVVEAIGREKLQAAFEIVRETGKMKSALRVIKSQASFYALLHFHPKIKKLFHVAKAEFIREPSSMVVSPAVLRAASSGDVMARVIRALPPALSRDMRDDVAGEIVLAVLEGRLRLDEIERRAIEFVRASFKQDHNRWGMVSLDMPAHPDNPTPLVETVTRGLWG
jgi:hypothetical protein